MSEKRRRARVQGGWASKDIPKSRSDAHKPEMPKAPAWLGKNADASNVQKFTYEEPVSDIKQKPKEKVIDKSGVYDISMSTNGLSRIRIFSNFIDPTELKHLYEQLFCEIPWKQQSDIKNGQTFLQPRLTAWFGDFSYSYSGITHEANIQWPAVVRYIHTCVADRTGFKPNSVELSFFRSHKDFQSWTKEKSTVIDDRPEPVIVLSLGQTSVFEMKPCYIVVKSPSLFKIKIATFDTWTPSLRLIKERLEENLGLKFNSMLANLYRDGHDSVSWHSDDESALRKDPVIASLSFGDTRMFELRHKPPPGEDPTDYTYMEHIKIPLEAGTLLIMEGATQEDWQHRIPREYHNRGPRINLTFRVIFKD